MAPSSTAETEERAGAADRGTDGHHSGVSGAAPSGKDKASPGTVQREAADAVAAGGYDRAAKLYEELARRHPNNPAYAEAATILRAKASEARWSGAPLHLLRVRAEPLAGECAVRVAAAS